jgi:hypothetical protein
MPNSTLSSYWKKISFLLLITLLMTSFSSKAQVFWTEDFTSPAWNINVVTGPEGPDANFFIVGDYEGGGITPDLGAPASCGVFGNLNNTLHVTSLTFPTGGAAYDAGGFCPLFSCPQTDKRTESPTINCTGKTNITLTFNYIENGDGANDDAALWYFDGATWSVLDNMPKTLTGCTGQGLWTSRTISMPASANNNPNVKIAFSWINNDDGVGTDPSFAVDDMAMSVPVGPTSITTSNLTQSSLCPCNTYLVDFTSTGTFGIGNIFTAQLSNALGSFASPVNIGTLASTANTGTISATIPCLTATGTAYRIRVISSNPAVNGADNGLNLSISQNPNAPTLVTSLPASLCDPGGNVQLSATSAGNSINWYTAAVGGSYLGNSASATNFPMSLSTTTTYYAEALIGGVAVSGSTNFSYTGGMQTFTVPPGINAVTIECYGAQGASAISSAPGTGGLGAYVMGTLAVTPGQVLNVFVGGQGSIASGGYNGGGVGGTDAGSGGGASDVRAGGTALANRVIVAGGGGGGGVSSDGCPAVFNGGNGGAGGGIAGSNGMMSPSGGGGFGGTVGAGGAPGIGCGNFLGSPGTVSTGGEGQLIGCSNSPSGGGGGGGYVNGGGGGGGSLGTVGCSGNEKGGGGGGAGGSSFTGTLTNTTSNNGVNVGNGSVTITWTGSPTSCVSSTRTPVTVAVNPIPVVTGTPLTTTVCPNAPVILQGQGASTYTWSGPQVVNNNQPFPATITGIYTVTGTSAAGCTSTATVSVNVINLVVSANATPASSVCVGNQVTLNGGGAISYTWSGGVNDNVAFTPSLGTITYTVTGTDGNGCTNTSSIAITASPLPNAPTGLTAVPSSLCFPGGTVQLTAFSANNSINWFNAPTAGSLLGTSASGTPFSTTVSSTTTFYAETSLIGVGGCVSTTRTPITVIVHPLPNVSSNPNLVTGCNNVTVTLAGQGANFYTWAGPQTIQNNVPFLANSSGIYTVTGTDANGCTNTSTAIVSVNPLPTVGINVNPGATICQGEQITLNGTGANTYTWTGGVTNGAPFVPSTTNSYTVTGSDAQGCSSTSSILIQVNPSTAPIVALSSNPTVVYGGTSTSYIATVPLSITTYQLDWYRNNSFFTTTFSPSNSITFVPTSQADSVYVILVPLSGCYFPANVKSNSILVRFPMDIENMDIPAGFTVYPNPTNGIINILGLDKGDEIVLTDIVGSVVLKKTVTSTNDAEKISLESLSRGVYHARFNRDGKNWVVKLIKE